MTEQQWLASDDPASMLAYLQGKVSDRKLRLFACSCCRQVWDKLAFPNDRKRVELAERRADDPDTAISTIHSEGLLSPDLAAYASTFHLDYRLGQAAAWALSLDAVELASQVSGWLAKDVPPATQAALLRDIVGNPFRPVTIPFETSFDSLRHGVAPSTQVVGKCPWLAWNDGTVPRLAAAIYAERAFDRMPILADALEEAGCADADILGHCRGRQRCGYGFMDEGKHYLFQKYGTWWESKYPCDHCNGTGWAPCDAPHARGCWVLDLLLGKE